MRVALVTGVQTCALPICIEICLQRRDKALLGLVPTPFVKVVKDGFALRLGIKDETPKDAICASGRSLNVGQDHSVRFELVDGESIQIEIFAEIIIEGFHRDIGIDLAGSTRTLDNAAGVRSEEHTSELQS